MTQPHHDPEAATMDHHTHHSGSYDEPQHPSSSSSSATATSGREADAGFFERERNRLIQDISKGVESILGNSNAVNRKIEESISVGKEFHPISELWSKFERIMHVSGIPNLHPQPSSTTSGATGSAASAASGGNAGGAAGEDKENLAMATPKRSASGAQAGAAAEEEGEEGALRFELTTGGAHGLPPGVAPGGGRIYA